MSQPEIRAGHAGGQLYRLPTVEAKTGLSKSEIYRRIKAGSFPAPLALGVRARAWTSASIDAWIRSLVQEAA